MGDAMDAWLATRPPAVRALAAEFPPGAKIRFRDATVYVLGFMEGDMLIVSEFDPRTDYDLANATRQYVCADHLRGKVKEIT